MRLLPTIILLTLMTAVSVLNAQVNLDSGLVAFYPFNGNADDESGNGNHGTVDGAALNTDRYGTPNSAYNFDGIDDAIDLGNAFESMTLPVSVSLWINKQGDGALEVDAIFASRDDGFTYSGFWINEIDNKIGISYGDGGAPDPGNRRSRLSEATFASQAWVHVVTIIRDSLDMSIFLDGQDAGGGNSGTGNEMNNGDNNFVGRLGFYELGNPGVGFWWTGFLDDIRIYDRALSEEEIAVLSQDIPHEPRVIVTHNSSAPSADSVDVSISVLSLHQQHIPPPGRSTEVLAVDSLGYKQSSSLLDLPYAGTQYAMEVDDLLGGSLINPVFFTAEAYTAYHALLQGIPDPGNFVPNPDGADISMEIVLIDSIRLSADQPGMVELQFIHGTTDLQTIDILQNGALLAGDLSYGDISGYTAVLPGLTTIDLVDQFDMPVATFEADLSAYADSAFTVFTTGFLDSAANQNGPALGLCAVTPGGTVLEFPRVFEPVLFFDFLADSSQSRILDYTFIAYHPEPDSQIVDISIDVSDIGGFLISYLVLEDTILPSASDPITRTGTIHLPWDSEKGDICGQLCVTNSMLSNIGCSDPDCATSEVFSRVAVLEPEVVVDNCNIPTDLDVTLDIENCSDSSIVINFACILHDDSLEDFAQPGVVPHDHCPGDEDILVLANSVKQESLTISLNQLLLPGEYRMILKGEGGEEDCETDFTFTKRRCPLPLQLLSAGSDSFKFGLSENYPNPFNPSTIIAYRIGENGHVSIKIYNILGEEVTTLVNREMPAGEHTIQWDGHDASGKKLSSGVYFYHMKAGEFQETRRMLLSK